MTSLSNQGIDLSSCRKLRSLVLVYYLGPDKRRASRTKERVDYTLRLLALSSPFPPLHTLAIEPEVVAAPSSLDLRDAICDAGISGSEALFLKFYSRGTLNGIIFRGPSHPFTLWSTAYRTSLRLSLPLLCSTGRLLYQEQGFGNLDEVEIL